jgi:hypothetical protein
MFQVAEEERIELEMEAYRRKVGYVYGIGCGRNLLKVGRAINPDARIKDFLIGNPFQLRMRYCIKAWHGYLAGIEGWLHKRLKKQHVRHEWFSGKPESFDIAFAEALEQFPGTVFAHEWIGVVWPSLPCRPVRPTEQAERELAETA